MTQLSQGRVEAAGVAGWYLVNARSKNGASNVEPAPEIRAALAAALLAVTDTGCELPPDVAGADVHALSVTASSAKEPAAG